MCWWFLSALLPILSCREGRWVCPAQLFGQCQPSLTQKWNEIPACAGIKSLLARPWDDSTKSKPEVTWSKRFLFLCRLGICKAPSITGGADAAQGVRMKPSRGGKAVTFFISTRGNCSVNISTQTVQCKTNRCDKNWRQMQQTSKLVLILRSAGSNCANLYFLFFDAA